MRGSHSKYVEITAAVTVPITTVKILEQKLSVPVLHHQGAGLSVPLHWHCEHLMDARSTPGCLSMVSHTRELSLLLPPSNKLVTESDGFVPEPVYASYTCNFNFILQLNYDRK